MVIIVYRQVWSSLCIDRVWLSLCIDEVWSLLCIDRMWSSLCIDKVWRSLCIDRYGHHCVDGMVVILYRQSMVIVVYRQGMVIMVHRQGMVMAIIVNSQGMVNWSSVCIKWGMIIILYRQACHTSWNFIIMLYYIILDSNKGQCGGPVSI